MGAPFRRLGEPARTLRYTQPDPPDKDRAARAEQHDPAPAVETEWRARHEHPGEQRDHRHGRELNRLIDRKGAAPPGFRDQFRKIGVDRDQLDADPDPRNEAPEIEAKRVMLEG